MLVFESNAINSEINKTNCTLATIPKEMISGVNSTKDQFLGLSNLHSVLSNFQEESEHMKTNLAINFTNIDQSMIDEKTLKTNRTINTFASQNKSSHSITSDKKAIDPSGSNQKPIVIQNFTDYVTNDIQSEMSLFSTAMSKLVTSAKKGDSFTKSSPSDPRRRNRASSAELLQRTRHFSECHSELHYQFHEPHFLLVPGHFLFLPVVAGVHRNWEFRLVHCGRVGDRLFLSSQR